MKYGKKIDVRFRYKMKGRKPVEEQVYRFDGFDVIYDKVLGRMYADTNYVDRQDYRRVSVALLFDLAERGEIDVWQFSNDKLIWMAQDGKVTNMFDAGIVEW